MRFAVDISNPAWLNLAWIGGISVVINDKTMGEKSKPSVELQQEFHAHQTVQTKARFMEARMPAKRRRHVWLIILLMAAVWICAYLEYSHTSRWPAVWHRGLLGACAFAAILLVSYIDSRRKQQEAARWYQQLDAVVDANDFQERNCLYDYLKPDERLRLLRALQQMPQGSRSLHQAVQKVSPVLIDDVI